MTRQYLRLRRAHTGVIHRCRLLQLRNPLVAPGANRASNILAARRISLRRPPAPLFQPVRSCHADAGRGRPLRARLANCHSRQYDYNSPRPPIQTRILSLPVRGVRSLFVTRCASSRRFLGIGDRSQIAHSEDPAAHRRFAIRFRIKPNTELVQKRTALQLLLRKPSQRKGGVSPTWPSSVLRLILKFHACRAR